MFQETMLNPMKEKLGNKSSDFIPTLLRMGWELKCGKNQRGKNKNKTKN